MGYARKTLICLGDTPYYHVIARCVRRAWLCGFDEYAGKDYSHRKTWALERLKYLAQSFSIDVCAYAVMSNHYHLVLHVDRSRATGWTRDEVVARWARLFRIPVVIDQWQRGTGGDAVREEAEAQIERLRHRLYDISCYMACLNEHLARRANAEDQCTGRFWEGRFKSQAVLDEPSLVTTMAYVDSNPMRAGFASSPQESRYTSVCQRITEMQREIGASGHVCEDPQVPLLDFQEHVSASTHAIPFRLADYVRLLDWCGRAIRREPGGASTQLLPAPEMLEQLNIDIDTWIAAMRPKGNIFGRALGRLDRLRRHANALGQAWIKGITQAQRLYRSAGVTTPTSAQTLQNTR